MKQIIYFFFALAGSAILAFIKWQKIEDSSDY